MRDVNGACPIGLRGQAHKLTVPPKKVGSNNWWAKRRLFASLQISISQDTRSGSNFLRGVAKAHNVRSSPNNQIYSDPARLSASGLPVTALNSSTARRLVAPLHRSSIRQSNTMNHSNGHRVLQSLEAIHWRTGMHKIIFSAALAATATALILTSFSQPADARRAGCAYAAHDAQGNMVSLGTGKAAKLKWACNRARRKCNRARSNTNVNRARRPISACTRI